MYTHSLFILYEGFFEEAKPPDQRPQPYWKCIVTCRTPEPFTLQCYFQKRADASRASKN